MRWLLLALALAGCSRDRFNYRVATERPPYINRFFDRNRLARVECGRYTGWRERFFVGDVEVSRRDYFTHLQRNVGWRLAGICSLEKRKKDRRYDEYVHAEKAVSRALETWEALKNRVDDPDVNLERYKETLR